MNKFTTNEKTILNVIKYGAILIVILFTILTTYILINQQEENLKNDIKNIEESFLTRNKIHVKNIVENAYEYVESEKRL